MPPEEQNRIEDLDRSMYSRNAPDIRSRRKMRVGADMRGPELKTAWERPPEDPEEDYFADEDARIEKKKMSFFTKLLIGSAIFCVVAVSAGAYIFFKGGNFISGNNIDVHISGPVSMAGGTPLTLSVTVTNKNTVALENATLDMQFPSGSTDPNDTTSSLEETKVPLGTIEPGGDVTKTVSAVIFGEENSQKSIDATVTYGISGSSSTFTKETSYDVAITSSPVVITVSSPKEITSGQQFDMTVDVKSNSGNTLKNVLLTGSYPFGFSFLGSSVRPLTPDNTVWALGDIPPGADRSIVIHGTLAGENTDMRAFHFSAGARSSNDPTAIGTTFTETEQDLTIQKPFVSLAISIDGDTGSGPHTGTFSRPENVVLKWTNNLPETLSNVVVTAHLSGSAYDKEYVNADTGYFRSASDDVIWNQQTNPELASVAAGSSGNLTFSVTPTQGSGSQIANPALTISATVTGNRTSDANVQLATAPVDRTTRITSQVSLSGRVVRSSGPFVNTGPIPPVADQKTTYTIDWSVDNTSNSVGNAVVTATLPPYVSWTGQTSPSTENISYDKNSGTVTWNIGNVNTFTYGTSQRREVSFQVAVQPSVDQIGQAPIIVNQAVLTAVDSWTNATVQDTQGYLTTSFSTDPAFSPGDETVAKSQ